jgi:hypothetical protein
MTSTLQMSAEVKSKFNQIRQLHPASVTDQEIYNILEQCQFNVGKAILQVMIREKQSASLETEPSTQENSNESPFAALLAMNNEKKSKLSRVVVMESFTIPTHTQNDCGGESEDEPSADEVTVHATDTSKNDDDSEDPQLQELSRDHARITSNITLSRNVDTLHNSCLPSQKRKKITTFLSDFWASDEEDNLDDKVEEEGEESPARKKTKYESQSLPHSISESAYRQEQITSADCDVQSATPQLQQPTTTRLFENKTKPFKLKEPKRISLKTPNTQSNHRPNECEETEKRTV